MNDTIMPLPVHYPFFGQAKIALAVIYYIAPQHRIGSPIEKRSCLPAKDFSLKNTLMRLYIKVNCRP